MVAPLVAAAGIGAVSSVLGGLFGGGGASKAAKIQQQTAREQIAAANANRDYQYNLNAPTINYGNEATDLYAGFFGLGDQAASGQALSAFRGSTGYQDLLREGLGAVNSNAYARGMGDSGATLKALQDRGAGIANQSYGNFTSGLGTLINAGNSARGLVAGIGANTVAAGNAASQNAADASSNAALYRGNLVSSNIQNLLNAGALAYGSSYGGNSPQVWNERPYGGILGGIY